MSTAKQKREAREAAAAAALAAAAKDPGAVSATEKLNEAATLNPGQVADAHGKIAKPSVAGQKVVVACKLGVAYFDIQLQKLEEKFEQNMQGGRTVKESTRIGGVVRLRGTSYPRGTPPKGFPAPPEIVAGAALNPGIDKDWFDEWIRQNRLNPLVMNRMIFAHETEDAARGEAREMREVQSGLEPLNPEGDSRLPRSTREEVADVETEDSRKSKTRSAARA